MEENKESDVSQINESIEDDGNTITMVDVLEEQKKLEEDAFAVLGASDDKNCTFNQGYVKRQALYSCRTCLEKDDDKPACICLACSYHCHEGHDLIELYTKRNFRCDCGNNLFKGRKCNLEPNKGDVNELNSYNQNFKGLYCTCSRPYPDLEDEINDEMLQCIVCEDWFHTRHLGTTVPTAEDYAEMICLSCTDKLPFLQYYLGHCVTKVKEEPTDAKVNVDCNGTDTPVKKETELNDSVAASSPSKDLENNIEASVNVEDDKSEKSPECLLKSLTSIPRTEKGATFWMEDLRKALCTCQTCQDLYKTHKAGFLTDPTDMVQAYEEEGQTRRISRIGAGSSSDYDRGMQALAKLDRTKQVEALHRYNELQENLKEYLAKFAENKKVVREEDIREFFSEMSRKKQKVEVPYYCH